MILTVCPNTALDKILFIDEWIPGTPMRTKQIVNSVGGKGLNSAVALSHLGVKTVGLGFFAGKIGQELVELVEDYGIIVDAVWVDGVNRIAHVIADAKNQQHSHVIAGEVIVSEDHKNLFIEKYHHHLQNANWVILAGSLPPSINNDFYVILIQEARKSGVPILIDSQKSYMKQAIKAKPDIVKMNWEEFEWTFSLKAEDLQSLKDQALIFRNENDLSNLVLTLSKDGILALTTEGDFLVKAPYQKPVNAAGAGDAVSAALAWRLGEGDKWESALRWASAVSAAAVLTERTGDLVMDDVLRLYPQIQFENLD